MNATVACLLGATIGILLGFGCGYVQFKMKVAKLSKFGKYSEFPDEEDYKGRISDR